MATPEEIRVSVRGHKDSEAVREWIEEATAQGIGTIVLVNIITGTYTARDDAIDGNRYRRLMAHLTINGEDYVLIREVSMQGTGEHVNDVIARRPIGDELSCFHPV